MLSRISAMRSCEALCVSSACLRSVMSRTVPIARTGRLRKLAVPYLRVLPPALLCLAGFVALVETAAFMSIGAAQGKELNIAGYSVEPGTWTPWIAGLALLAAGGLWLKAESRVFARTWNALMEAAKADLAGTQGGGR